MKLHYYPETDSLYIELKSEPGAEVREVADGLNVDLSATGTAPISGAYLYQLKLAGWPKKLPGAIAFRLHEQFHGP